MIASKITCDDTYSTDPVASSVGARLPSRRSTRWYVNCAPTSNGNLMPSPAHSGNSRPWFGGISRVQVPAWLVTLFQLLPQERSPTRNRAIELPTPSAGRSSTTPPRTLRQAPRSRHHPDLKLEDTLLQLRTVFVYTSRPDLEVLDDHLDPNPNRLLSSTTPTPPFTTTFAPSSKTTVLLGATDLDDQDPGGFD